MGAAVDGENSLGEAAASICSMVLTMWSWRDLTQVAMRIRIGFWWCVRFGECQYRLGKEAYSRVVVFDGVDGVPWEAVCLDGIDCSHGVAASMLRCVSGYSII